MQPRVNPIDSPKHWVGVYLKGMAMGAADLVPGVSGGTLALITGVYPRLISALSAFDFSLLALLKPGRFGVLCRRVDALFLATLGAGMVSAILVFAHLISELLQRYPSELMGFFWGLILCASVQMARTSGPRTALEYLLFALGILLVCATLTLPDFQLLVSWWVLIIAGFFTISAMLLPGLSGSFLLLLFGLYEPVVNAVRGLEWLLLLSFATGAALGFITFSHVINWLLIHRARMTMNFLLGLLSGSLIVLWPTWQEPAVGPPADINSWAIAVAIVLGVALYSSLLLLAGRLNKSENYLEKISSKDHVG